MKHTTSPLEYAPMTLDEIQALPAGTILAQTWSHSDEPELFQRASSWHFAGENWLVLTAAPRDYEYERWTDAAVHSEHALYSVVYQPEATS